MILTRFLADEADSAALDEYVSQEQAMEVALRETMGSSNNGHRDQSAGPNVSFSDDEYDDIFMTLADPVQSSQDMDMS